MANALFLTQKKTPLIRQVEGSECGLACLAMIANYHGYDTDLNVLRRSFHVSLRGSTLSELIEISNRIGLHTRALRGEIKDLEQVQLPAILHWDLDHFVVLTSITKSLKGQKYHIHDPANGSFYCKENEISRRFTGVILELSKSESFKANHKAPKISIKQMWNRIDGFWGTLRITLYLSIVMQIAAILLPFFMQISIDSVLPSSDKDLLVVLAFGFSGVVLISTLSSWLRSINIIQTGTSLSYQVSVNLFRHLMHLPLPWFERRHVGDIASRFSSLKPVCDLFTQGLVTALIDGLLALSTMVLILIYSPLAGAISLAAVLLFIILKLASFEIMKNANLDVLSANSNENSSFIESLRGISTIKSFGEESNRQRIWQNKKAYALNSEVKSGKLVATFSAIEGLIFGIEQIIFIYVAIKLTMTGYLSLGMVFALQSYRGHFLESVRRFTGSIINFRFVDMHLARISDIALSHPESVENEKFHGGPKKDPARITFRNVWFRYSNNDPDILKGVNLDILPGKMVALIGPSGEGKTTLVKIMMGLLKPTYGEVLIDSIPLSDYGYIRWRKEISSVLQDDTLFAGTVADNVALFSHEQDNDKLQWSLKLANIDTDVDKLPMKTSTLVGDMGSVFSGGQRQRLMIARAVYKCPRFISFDEATAHLDSESENIVGNSIKSLDCTRLVVAHRPQTLERADSVFALKNGVLHDVKIVRS